MRVLGFVLLLLGSLATAGRLRGVGDLMITSSVNGAIDLESPTLFRLPASTIVDVDPIVIDASCGTVWQAMLDFPSYGAWNEFAPSVNVSDAPPVVGSSVSMRVSWQAAGLKYFPDIHQTEYVSAVVADAKQDFFAISYGGSIGLSLLMAFERVQFLRPPQTGGSSRTGVRGATAEQCEYKTFDRFGGVLNIFTNWLFGEAIHKGFTLAQAGLKEYVEARARGQQPPSLQHTSSGAHTEL